MCSWISAKTYKVELTQKQHWKVAKTTALQRLKNQFKVQKPVEAPI
jgi:hypothetical protein